MRFDGAHPSWRLSLGGPRAGKDLRHQPRASVRDVLFQAPVNAGTRLETDDGLFLVTQIRDGGRAGTIKPLLSRPGVRL